MVGVSSLMVLAVQTGELLLATGVGTCGYATTAYLKGAVRQPLAVVVMVYTTVIGRVLVLSKASSITLDALVTAGLLMPGTAARLQL